ncbi:YggT family protein [Microbacterium sp. STN6]|uniref:YggT family protein n=1 Tax=Microbacterium sp. STN6 TaxID=2995588 RepID=UPI002260C37B|nr:YggT family protein [Microbacterium sp. STN6]MCX7521517.1 YggT family protein [Microbacterium sp. STN6]
MNPVVSLVATVLYFLLLIFFFLMWGRFILDLVRTFNRSWRPHGFGLVAAEAVYSVTDPPIRMFRRILPPLRLGPVAIDFGWSLTMLVCIICLYIALAFQ